MTNFFCPSVAALQRRLPARLSQWSVHFAAAQLEFGVDPFVLAAICDRESLGGEALKPKGQAGKGDFKDGEGRAHGLMQIDRRFHATFLAMTLSDGRHAWMDAGWNIRYGASLLAHNLARAHGDYSLAIAGYNADFNRCKRALDGLTGGKDMDKRRIRVLDECTTGKDYLSDVLARAKSYQEAA